VFKKILLSFLLFGIILSLSFFAMNRKKPLKKTQRPDVTIIGHIKMADGIGRQTVELANVLLDDFKVDIIAGLFIKEDVPDRIRRLLRGKEQCQLGKVVILEESLWCPGTKLSRVLKTVKTKDQIRIAYSMLESTRIPQEWVLQLNLYYDAVVVPDEFLVEAYRKSGVELPIFVVPLGLDIDGLLKAPIKSARNKQMVFANLSSCLDRKNQITLIRAFAKVLGNKEDAILRINCRNGDMATREAIIEEIKNQDCSNIHFTEFTLKKDAYEKLLQSVDCYVSLSKGEGFSIQPREAMALGIPVIVTNNTGQSTICKSGLVRGVEAPFLEPCYYFERDIPTGYRFNCSEEDAAEAIYDVYQNYDHYLSHAEEARKWASFYSYSNSYLKELYKCLVSPKKVILGSENTITPEFFITDCKELYEKYVDLGICRNRQ
jgi:glycosyltransferase involved in cell wall biosynthesis